MDVQIIYYYQFDMGLWEVRPSGVEIQFSIYLVE